MTADVAVSELIRRCRAGEARAREELGERLRHLAHDRREDLVFENVQARMRTSLLMNTGFVVGTGYVSEAALGWATYNGDHMSMYNPNSSIPKTLVKFLVDWAARNEFEGEVRKTLLDIVDTVISPELLPNGRGLSLSAPRKGGLHRPGRARRTPNSAAAVLRTLRAVDKLGERAVRGPAGRPWG